MGIKGVFLDLRNNSHVILVKSVDLIHVSFFVNIVFKKGQNTAMRTGCFHRKKNCELYIISSEKKIMENDSSMMKINFEVKFTHKNRLHWWVSKEIQGR